MTVTPMTTAASQERRRGLASWLGLALLVIVLDQLTKTLIVNAFDLGESQPVGSVTLLPRFGSTTGAIRTYRVRWSDTPFGLKVP